MQVIMKNRVVHAVGQSLDRSRRQVTLMAGATEARGAT